MNAAYESIYRKIYSIFPYPNHHVDMHQMRLKLWTKLFAHSCWTRRTTAKKGSFVGFQPAGWNVAHSSGMAFSPKWNLPPKLYTHKEGQDASFPVGLWWFLVRISCNPALLLSGHSVDSLRLNRGSVPRRSFTKSYNNQGLVLAEAVCIPSSICFSSIHTHLFIYLFVWLIQC